jgi:hypothetical protein
LLALTGFAGAQNEWAGPGSNNTTAAIYRSGNVGIGPGIFTPADRLHIISTSNDGITIEQGSYGGAMLTLKNTQSGGRTFQLLSGGPANTNSSGDFSIWDPGASLYRFIIKGATGNVGIGTTGPGNKLEVSSNQANDGVKVIQTTGQAAAFHLENQTSGGRHWALFSTGAGNTQGAGHFSIYDYNSNTDRFFIDGSTGYVGIGTTSPLARLYVEETSATSGGAGYFEMNVSSAGQNTGLRGFGSGSSGSNQGGIFAATGTGQNMGVWSVVSGNPGDWAGYFNGDVNIVGKAYCTLNMWSSDRKLKKDIQPLTNSMAKITQLKPSSYLFRRDEFKTSNLPEGLQLGLIAQELEEVFPELVSELGEQPMLDEKGKISGTTPGHKVVNYIGLIPVLIGGMQEQQQLIVSQQKQLDDQKALINELTQKMSGTTATGVNSIPSVDTGFQMSQNEPNPFTHETVVKYTLPQTIGNAFMAVYDLTGKQIATFAINEKGSSSLTITSEKLAAGIYIYSIVADGKVVDSKRMIVSEK